VGRFNPIAWYLGPMKNWPKKVSNLPVVRPTLGPRSFVFLTGWLVWWVGWLVGWLVLLGDTATLFVFSSRRTGSDPYLGHRMCSNRQKSKEMASANVCSPSFPILFAANCMSCSQSTANKSTSRFAAFCLRSSANRVVHRLPVKKAMGPKTYTSRSFSGFQ
jgi:hypothetical protein